MNGIILNGKVYEVVPASDCKTCDFDKDVKNCDSFCNACAEWDCAFRFSQTLTDKLNKE